MSILNMGQHPENSKISVSFHIMKLHVSEHDAPPVTPLISLKAIHLFAYITRCLCHALLSICKTPIIPCSLSLCHVFRNCQVWHYIAKCGSPCVLISPDILWTSFRICMSCPYVHYCKKLTTRFRFFHPQALLWLLPERAFARLVGFLCHLGHHGDIHSLGGSCMTLVGSCLNKMRYYCDSRIQSPTLISRIYLGHDRSVQTLYQLSDRRRISMPEGMP